MRTNTIAILLLALILGVQPITASPRRLILQVQAAPLAWGECRLADQLKTALSRNSDLRVVMPNPETSDYPPLPHNRYDIDSLVDWGTEIGGQYLMIVVVERESLERQKTFSVPLLFQRWETVGIIEGELRILDLKKRRLVVAKPFSVKQSGSRQFQGEGDDNRNDPALHLPASEKSRFFYSLESKLVHHLLKEVRRLTRGR